MSEPQKVFFFRPVHLHPAVFIRDLSDERGNLCTRRRWWQRRVPVAVPESLVRGAVYSAQVNGAIRFNAELRERTEGLRAKPEVAPS